MSLHTRNDATQLASRFEVDGEELYSVGLEEWRTELGLIRGRLIYEYLQESEYGYVSFHLFFCQIFPIPESYFSILS